jgi:hypothetical protein
LLCDVECLPGQLPGRADDETHGAFVTDQGKTHLLLSRKISMVKIRGHILISQSQSLKKALKAEAAAFGFGLPSDLGPD